MYPAVSNVNTVSHTSKGVTERDDLAVAQKSGTH